MRITETFVSLQGEGLRQGMPCMFVRFAGCNLHCAWCDTRYSLNNSQGIEMTPEEVMQAVIASGMRYVCITGGEPLLQKEELVPLIAAMHEAGVAVDIETNGTIPFDEVQEFASVCMDVKCPSSGEMSDLSLLDLLRSADSAKFVIGDEADYLYMVEVLAAHPHLSAPVCITPVFGTDVKWLVETIIAEKLPVRFQLQLHKVVNIP
ncbi:MAG: 7-carboxy-7-deazaguanine synthase QueE [Methanocorpusculum sp.]|uniref:7-carboxy-7-deazaguanine synthase n=1 Tax=Methanocorpusculum petauri TaxID=3002863 RepID=A0ABT4IG21_9EURY|nr:7-carboxy-7-deazaguanine synthase QueE [Methanocorpusculum petauri]MCZ9311737.1 7-carboxy-7-deazaguanine synthase QueE [Methanocorpusculum sp.]MDE2443136.1 7-carboxy-7-deazaguanine synthase QueE [Methanocorpusculum sp.]MDE2518280.1 7-carboxy-7-deazaguanine synthase QueE [Methanocorpusculum sp.]MDE2521637.1 7-carboxy-7-deazaguanine synthase QueE [Methanocorpusculum sp.]